MADRIIAVSGGIGAGKSTVSNVLRRLGYPVYDTDSEAKRLMDADSDLKDSLAEIFGTAVIDSDGRINRKQLARIVFADADKLNQLNRLVHHHVVDDVKRWVTEKNGPVFVETALLYQSGLDQIVDEVWEVDAPREIRTVRASRRDNSSLDDILLRIESQDRFQPEKQHPRRRHIINDGFKPLLPQILKYLE